jgi:hypothetical protein
MRELLEAIRSGRSPCLHNEFGKSWFEVHKTKASQAYLDYARTGPFQPEPWPASAKRARRNGPKARPVYEKTS